MNNERIDLTQFDAITKGTWEVIELPGGGIDIGVRYTNHGHKPVVNFTQRMGEQVKQIERDVADMDAIAAVPELIAELKKCYYEIDLLREYAKCVECSGQYIGPMDYGSHEWDHSEDCVYASE